MRKGETEGSDMGTVTIHEDDELDVPEGGGTCGVLGQLDDLLDAVEREPETMRAMIVLTFETPAALQSFSGWFDGLIGEYEAELANHLAAGQADGSVKADLDPAREAEVFVSYAIGQSPLPNTEEIFGPISSHVSGLIRPSLKTPRTETVICLRSGAWFTVKWVSASLHAVALRAAKTSPARTRAA